MTQEWAWKDKPRSLKVVRCELTLDRRGRLAFAFRAEGLVAREVPGRRHWSLMELLGRSKFLVSVDGVEMPVNLILKLIPKMTVFQAQRRHWGELHKLTNRKTHAGHSISRKPRRKNRRTPKIIYRQAAERRHKTLTGASLLKASEGD